MMASRKTVTRYTFEMHADPGLGTPMHVKPNAIEIDVGTRRTHAQVKAQGIQGPRCLGVVARVSAVNSLLGGYVGYVERGAEDSCRI